MVASLIVKSEGQLDHISPVPYEASPNDPVLHVAKDKTWRDRSLMQPSARRKFDRIVPPRAAARVSAGNSGRTQTDHCAT
jgi:hypothetical protein